ncbi:MAG: hypothetical protein JWO17_3241 [Actinomycetia bacterium]|nr:hypothetical protein [Actinomycetes bacterium]
MRRTWLGVVIVIVAVGVGVVVATFSRGGEKAPKPYTPPAASQQFGDDADLMRRLERKKLLQRQANSQHR